MSVALSSAAAAPASAAPRVAYPVDEKRRKLRIAIVTGESASASHLRRQRADARCSPPENFLPKVDGVTRTLARLLEHLNAEGHEAIVCGPETGIVSTLLRELYRIAESAADQLCRPPRRGHVRPAARRVPRPQAELPAAALHSPAAAVQA